MNIVSKVAFKSMSRNKTRTIVTMVGIVLAAAMFTAVLGGALTLWDYLVRGAQHVNGDYYIACYYPDQTQMEELKENEEVISLAEYQAMGFVYFDDNQSTITSFVLAAVDQSFFNTMPVRLIEGRLPRSSREILLPETAMGLMKHYGYPWAVGQHVELPVQTSCSFYNYQMVPPQTEERSFSATYTIVGIAEDSFYGAEDGAKKAAFLRKRQDLSAVSAVKHDRIFPLGIKRVFPGIGSVDTIRRMAHWFRAAQAKK